MEASSSLPSYSFHQKKPNCIANFSSRPCVSVLFIYARITRLKTEHLSIMPLKATGTPDFKDTHVANSASKRRLRIRQLHRHAGIAPAPQSQPRPPYFASQASIHTDSPPPRSSQQMHRPRMHQGTRKTSDSLKIHFTSLHSRSNDVTPTRGYIKPKLPSILTIQKRS
jgi:hypothetical protein